MSTITVTSSADSGAGSLRAAIASAASGDTIVFAVSSVQIVSTLSIDVNLTIEGASGHAPVDIHQGLGTGSALVVEAGATVSLSDLSISGFNGGQSAPANAVAGEDGADGPAGLNATSPGESGTKGGDGDAGQDATMATGAAIGPAPALENDGTLTLFRCEIDGVNGMGANGADGADGGLGGRGGDGGAGISPGNGANGGIGGDGGSGSAGTAGGNAVGGVINTGTLILEDSVISGVAAAGDGGAGGKGGDGSGGGVGGAGANDGEGGNGGSGGLGGDGGDGGSAVGGIVNTGSVRIIGAAILFGDSAQAGKGGAGGDGGAAGAGGVGNGDGADGDAGADGASGVTGTQTVDYLDKGSTSGAFTINGYLYDFVDLQQPSSVSVGSGANDAVTLDYAVEEFGGYTGGFPQTGSVEWEVVTGAGGPPLGDFVGATSGTLDFDASQAGNFLTKNIFLQLKGDSAAAGSEKFTVQLFDPATGDVLGAANSVVQNVINQLGSAGAHYYANTGGQTIIFADASGDVASLSTSGGVFDSVFGSGGKIDLSDAQAKVIGGGNAITASGAGDKVKLFSTGGRFDTVFGSDLIAYVVSAEAGFIGGGDSIRTSGSGDRLKLLSTGANADKVFGPNLNANVANAEASFVSGGDVIRASGSGDVLKLFATFGQFDKVYGSNLSASLINAQASFTQGGDTIRLLTPNETVKLFSTGAKADTVIGSDSTIQAIGAQVKITGAGDTVDLFDNDTVSLIGGSFHLLFQPAIGKDTINGFAASDTLQFSAQDFANFAALQGHATQSGADAVIALDASDSVTLTGVTATSLSASQFRFV